MTGSHSAGYICRWVNHFCFQFSNVITSDVITSNEINWSIFFFKWSGAGQC